MPDSQTFAYVQCSLPKHPLKFAVRFGLLCILLQTDFVINENINHPALIKEERDYVAFFVTSILTH